MHDLHTTKPALFETKATSEGVISGLASPYGGTPDSYGDVIAPGAWSKSLAERTPVMLWSHDMSRVAGKWTEFRETSAGLAVTGQLNLQTTQGKEAYHHIRAGDLDGLSVGFRIPKGGAEWTEDGGRVIKQADLYEISLVSVPAAPSARVSEVKSISRMEDLRTILREIGLSNRAAHKVAVAGFEALEGKTPDEFERAAAKAAKRAAQKQQLTQIADLIRRHR
jgi:hypothetical protein